MPLGKAFYSPAMLTSILFHQDAKTNPDAKQMFTFVVFNKKCYELNQKLKLLSTVINAYQVLLFCTSGGKAVTVNKLLIVGIFFSLYAMAADGLINMQHFVMTFVISEGIGPPPAWFVQAKCTIIQYYTSFL